MEIITTKISPHLQRVSLIGEFDMANRSQLELILSGNLDRGYSLIVDLRSTKFFDSSVLHALILAYQRAQARGQKLVILKDHNYVSRILEVSGVDQVIPVTSSEAEALELAGQEADKF